LAVIKLPLTRLHIPSSKWTDQPPAFALNNDGQVPPSGGPAEDSKAVWRVGATPPLRYWSFENFLNLAGRDSMARQVLDVVIVPFELQHGRVDIVKTNDGASKSGAAARSAFDTSP
jgi:hypothetical protein